MAEHTGKTKTGVSVLTNCIGLREDGQCKLLNIPVCCGVKCTYYKKTDSLAKAFERLSSLPEAKQESIAQKYYGGFRPWNGNSINYR